MINMKLNKTNECMIIRAFAAKKFVANSLIKRTEEKKT